MKFINVTRPLALIFLAVSLAPAVRGETRSFRSHPPMRPLPAASARPQEDGPARFVDAGKGDDRNDGSLAAPWKSLGHAAAQIRAGDTLYLRGGTYYEHVTVSARGTHDAPITIRSFPGELAILDGGLREFFETPQSAWEPVREGAAGEYRSTRAYPDLAGRSGGTNVLGNFGDSMVPLHGYRFLSDLRSANEYFSNINAGKTEAGDGIYCGPGVYYDVESGRIHVRLAHTNQKALGEDNFRGETDPRKLPLVIAGARDGSPLAVEKARYIRFQDLVVRGARDATISVSSSVNIEFDGVTAYGGSSAMRVADTAGLRLWNCACRGIAAPWTYRGSLKYRAIEARIFSASGWAPTGNDNRDFELAYSEFTDCADGVFIGNVHGVEFHHNLLDNISDDGIFLTATTAYDGTTPGGAVRIYQNLLARCLTTFAFGVGHGRQKMTPAGRQTGAGVFVYRNVFDFRRPVMYQQPAEGEAQITSYGRVAGDHGGPAWEPMTVYHNTIVLREPPFRGYYAGGLGGHMAGGTRRQVMNNIVIQAEGKPGFVLPPVVPPPSKVAAAPDAPQKAQPADPLADLLDGDVQPKKTQEKKSDGALAELKGVVAKKKTPTEPLPIDFQADGNLHFSYGQASTADELFGRFRQSPDFEASKTWHKPGWTAHDAVADPQLVAFTADWRKPLDCRLDSSSPAIDAGIKLPAQWPDPLRGGDQGDPDIGAMPLAGRAWNVGVGGRLSVFGGTLDNSEAPSSPGQFLIAANQVSPDAAHQPAAVVQGYPAFDAPLVQFALRKERVPAVNLERTWLDPAEYSNYKLIVVLGDLVRAKIEPNRYDADDLDHVQRFLEEGGTLLLGRGNTALFATPEGRARLTEWTGTSTAKAGEFEVLSPQHAWLEHLASSGAVAFPLPRHAQPIRALKGEIVIGHQDGLAVLYRVQVGKGQLIYVGWDVSASLPHGRSPSTAEQEAAFEQQMQILLNIVAGVYPRSE